MSHKKLSRSQQSRINGAKSKGAVTEEGRARSALNRTSHGMYSVRTVLEDESVEIFNLLASRYHDAFQPRDQFETDLLENMINSRWKIRRLEAAISAEMNLTAAEHREDVKYKFGPIDPATRAALSYRANAKHIDILEEHLERQQRTFLRSFRALRTHRGGQLPPQEQLANIETGIPNNVPPEPQPQKNGFEPSAAAHPGLARKIAIVIVLLLSAIASTLPWNATKPPQRTPPAPYAAL